MRGRGLEPESLLVEEGLGVAGGAGKSRHCAVVRACKRALR